jgi:uncharacterized protein
MSLKMQIFDALRLARRRLANALKPDVHVSEPPPGIAVDWDIDIPMRDGTVLRANIFRPAGEGRFPIVMSAHPYGKDRIPAKTRSGRGVNFQYRLFPQPRPIHFSSWTSWEAPDPAVWVPRGYVVVNADLRGGGTSEGVAELLSDQEAQDYYDLIEWAAAQPWSNGRVGLDGVSYLALSQYKAAALRPPHLAAICPWEGFSDLYRDFLRPGGLREDGFSIVWNAGTHRAARVAEDLRKELIAREQRDDWYAAKTPDLERIDVPMLVCGSFSDHSLHSRGAFEAFRRAGSAQKYLYTHRDGKWCAYYSAEATAARIRFFDAALKGENNGWREQPPVTLRIYDRGDAPVAVVGEDSWPPTDLDWRPLYLDAAEKSLTAGAAPAASSIAAVETRGAGVQFFFAFDDDMDVIGPMALTLFVEAQDGLDIRLFAGVRKFRGGDEIRFEGSYGFAGDMVSKGWQRLAHRELDAELSTPQQPVHRHECAEPLREGEIARVDIALLPQATRFLRGDRLRLDLRGTWHFPRNPLFGQFPVGYQPGAKGVCVLHTGADHPSSLLIGARPCAATAAKTRI